MAANAGEPEEACTGPAAREHFVLATRICSRGAGNADLAPTCLQWCLSSWARMRSPRERRVTQTTPEATRKHRSFFSTCAPTAPAIGAWSGAVPTTSGGARDVRRCTPTGGGPGMPPRAKSARGKRCAGLRTRAHACFAATARWNERRSQGIVRQNVSPAH